MSLKLSEDQKANSEVRRFVSLKTLPPLDEALVHDTSDATRLCQNLIVSVVMTTYNQANNISQSIGKRTIFTQWQDALTIRAQEQLAQQRRLGDLPRGLNLVFCVARAENCFICAIRDSRQRAESATLRFMLRDGNRSAMTIKMIKKI